MLSSELDAFDKQVLSLRQQIQQTESETDALLQVLSVWTGESEHSARISYILARNGKLIFLRTLT